MQNSTVLRSVGGRGSSVAVQFSDFRTVVAWIRTRASNDELPGDTLRLPATHQFFDYSVTHGSSSAAHFIKLRMVYEWQSYVALRPAGPFW